MALHLSITTVRTFVGHMYDTRLDNDGDAQHNETYIDDESSRLYRLTSVAMYQTTRGGGWSHGASVDTAASMWAGRSGVPVPTEAIDSSLFQKVQTCCGAHPTSCTISTGIFSRGLRGVMQTTPPPSSAEVKNEWSYPSTPSIRLHGVDNFTNKCEQQQQQQQQQQVLPQWTQTL